MAYAAEAIGTFGLSLVVVLTLVGKPPLPVPVLVALTLGLFVYSVGHISGTHLNPAVTLGLLSIKKISWEKAFGYLIAQFIGAALALAVGKLLGIQNLDIPDTSALIAISEAVGTFFFTFGIAAVVFDKAPKAMSGAVVGGSLLLGIVISSAIGSAGILNPAVELAVGMFSPMYVFGAILGSIIGFNVYALLNRE
ncbi:hypothetical protein BH10PAT2_BH10PAT2_1910 [soil metagenome]